MKVSMAACSMVAAGIVNTPMRMVMGIVAVFVGRFQV